MTITLMPRIIRVKDAPAYVGMTRNRFNSDVRPHIQALQIGDGGIGFDRLDLDAWVDTEKQRQQKDTQWHKNAPQDLLNAATPGTSTNAIAANSSAAALEQTILQKRKNT